MLTKSKTRDSAPSYGGTYSPSPRYNKPITEKQLCPHQFPNYSPHYFFFLQQTCYLVLGAPFHVGPAGTKLPMEFQEQNGFISKSWGTSGWTERSVSCTAPIRAGHTYIAIFYCSFFFNNCIDLWQFTEILFLMLCFNQKVILLEMNVLFSCFSSTVFTLFHHM